MTPQPAALGTEGNINISAAKGSNPGKSLSTDAFVVEPTEIHTHTFILLHGLGSNGEKFGQELLNSATSHGSARLQNFLPHARFIFPTAQWRRSSAFRRSVLTQWFDIFSLSDPSIRQDVQYEGLAESAKAIRAIIVSESQNVPLANIILGGLSQGCAMSLSVLLSLDHSLGGFIGMSGWLPFETDIAQLAVEEGEQDDDEDGDIFDRGREEDQAPTPPMVKAANFQRDALSIESLDNEDTRTALRTPVFIGHGEADQKIPYHLGKSAAQTLRAIGLDVTWKGYAGQGHWYKVPDELDDILDFLEKRANITLARPEM